jgi:hypothetical protein
MTPSRIRYGLALVAVLFLAMAIMPAEAAAPAAAAAQAAKAATASPFAAQVAALHQARELLVNADHDYKGHRAEAVKLVTAAIHELHPHHAKGAHAKGGAGKGAAKAHAGAKQGAGKGTGNTMPQEVSDGHLKQAMSQIAAVQTQLAGAGGQGPAAAAATALGKAVQELQTALSIK